MTTEEVIREITSVKKYHVGIIKQSTASRIISRIKQGRCTLNKQIEFFGLFGYTKQLNWVKKDEK